MNKRTTVSTVQTPRRYAAYLSLGYLVPAFLWIQYSGYWALSLAGQSASLLQQIERSKGILFISLTSLGVYVFSRLVFSHMARYAQSLVKSEQARAEAERQAMPAMLAASVAHDVANLLTVFRLSIERLKSIPTVPAEANGAIAKLDRSTDRLTELVERLRGASRSLLRDKPRKFNFSATLEDTLDLMESHASLAHAEVEYDGPAHLSLCGYPVLIHQLVMNLLLNAAEAAIKSPRIRLTANALPEHAGLAGGVQLFVDDNGPGIPSSLRSSILGAFFTTKATGTGLGLMSVRTCVEIHGGTLEIAESPMGGARFAVTLPHLPSDSLLQGHWNAVPIAEVPMVPVDSMRM